MAADLHIHVLTNGQDLRILEIYLNTEFSTNSGQKIGDWVRGYREFLVNGEWMRMSEVPNDAKVEDMRSVIYPNITDKMYDEAIARTADYWVGEVSWLKAAFSEQFSEEDPSVFIPGNVQAVSDLIPGLVMLDEELKDKIVEAAKKPNQTGYSTIHDTEGLEEFLTKHLGKLIFTISW